MSELFDAVRNPILDDQKSCDHLIRESLKSSVEIINKIGDYIIQSGGKRLRPLLVLLSSKAFGYHGQSHIKLAAVIELLHTATLLHDDVVDHSELRRNQPTANKVWGDHASVLVGDYLYSRAFQLMVDVNNMKVMEIIANSSNQMAEGEMLQLLNCHQPDVTEENYMKVIHCKTGTLFAAAAQMGPVLVNASNAQIESMYHYGSCLGSAFQLIDDALDYSGNSKEMGKNMGDDLVEGKPTLPFIRALSQVKDSDAEILRRAISEGTAENIDNIIKIINSTDAISYTYEAAKRQALKAKEHLHEIPESVYSNGLLQLIDFAVQRRF
ncbi:MAG TPA: polyprenyl synthetase family protein [Gammaproteobacteria bacterium]|nr:polyprenyl synthetase family protein [Gammaproteobacteria bacterium]